MLNYWCEPCHKLGIDNIVFVDGLEELFRSSGIHDCPVCGIIAEDITKGPLRQIAAYKDTLFQSARYNSSKYNIPLDLLLSCASIQARTLNLLVEVQHSALVAAHTAEYELASKLSVSGDSQVTVRRLRGFEQTGEDTTLAIPISSRWSKSASFHQGSSGYGTRHGKLGDLTSELPQSERRATRTPLKSEVSTVHVKAWLKSSDRRASLQSKSASLGDLRRRGRLRVIDVKNSSIVPLPEGSPYFALSYVWGNAMRHYTATVTGDISSELTLSATEDQLITPNMVPKVVRDAIELVRRLGQRLIWVDALCIRQNDAEEKQDVISQMGSIYQNAYATIIGCSGQDAEAGLPSLYPDPSRAETDMAPLPRRQSFKQMVEGSKWNSRAWTYQERILSTRCIFFFDDEVAFTCSDGLCRESFDTYEYDETPVMQYPIEGSGGWYERLMRGISPDWSDYRAIVNEYSSRDLSHPGDRLDAFMGIAKRFSKRHGRAHDALSALPLAWFGAGLLWSPPEMGALPSRIAQNAVNARRIPSWCWAGWTGTILYKAKADSFMDMSIWKLGFIDENNLSFGLRSEVCLDSDRPWPYIPEPTTSIPPCVTLHLWVPAMRCRVSAGRLLVPEGFSSILGTISHDLEKREDENPSYELVLFLGNKLHDDGQVSSILIERHDAFFERVPVAVQISMPADFLLRHAEYNHIQLR